MPKIKTPKLIIRKDGRAVVHWKGKMHVMGRSGTKEAQTAYHRFCIEIAENPLAFTILSEIADATIEELCARYVEFAAGRMHPANFLHCKIIISDFLLYLYGDFQVNLFTPRCLKRVQFAMVQSRRFCRRQINDHVKRIVAMFRWGVEEDMVEGSTWHALKAVKALRAGEHGTFDHAERLPVPDDVVVLTLRYLPPVVSAMVQIQGMTGMRPSELCGMRVGDIAQSGDVWQYRPKNHKTEAYIGKKTVHLGKAEQELLAPYLIGKKPESAVFSPAQAMKERNVEKRANRQSKITPSQADQKRLRDLKQRRNLQ